MPESSRSRLAGAGSRKPPNLDVDRVGEAAEAGAERVVAELADQRHQRQRLERAGGGAVELAEQQLDPVGPDRVHLEAYLREVSERNDCPPLVTKSAPLARGRCP